MFSCANHRFISSLSFNVLKTAKVVTLDEIARNIGPINYFENDLSSCMRKRLR